MKSTFERMQELRNNPQDATTNYYNHIKEIRKEIFDQREKKRMIDEIVRLITIKVNNVGDVKELRDLLSDIINGRWN